MSTPVYLDTYLGERQIQPRGLMAYFACTEVTILRGGNYKWINLIVGCSSNLKSCCNKCLRCRPHSKGRVRGYGGIGVRRYRGPPPPLQVDRSLRGSDPRTAQPGLNPLPSKAPPLLTTHHLFTSCLPPGSDVVLLLLLCSGEGGVAERVLRPRLLHGGPGVLGADGGGGPSAVRPPTSDPTSSRGRWGSGV